MKRSIPLLMLTVMLRVWFYDQSYCDFRDVKNMTLHSGIYVGTFGERRGSPFMVVRMDDGALMYICTNGIAKTKLVEVKSERDK